MMSVLALVPPRASARIAVEPVREVLRGANDDLRACSTERALPSGRYAVRLRIDATGKVEDVEVVEAPIDLSPASASCIEAAFTRLAFPPFGAASRASIAITWPFVLER